MRAVCDRPERLGGKRWQVRGARTCALMGARRIERLGAVATNRRAAETLQRGSAGAEAVIIRPDSMLLLDSLLCVQGYGSTKPGNWCSGRLKMQEVPLTRVTTAFASSRENLYARPSCHFLNLPARGPRLTSRYEASCRGIVAM